MKKILRKHQRRLQKTATKLINQHVDKALLSISYFLRFLIILQAVIAAWNKNILLIFLSFSILILTFLPSYVARNYKLTLPTEFEFLAVFFIFSSLISGNVHGYYDKLWWWDIFLHSLSGIILGFIGFLLVYTLYKEKRVRMRPSFVFLFSFCFALAIGALWEIFEFTVDIFYPHLRMQGSGLVDTMVDLILDAIGAFIVSLFGYLHVKHKRSLFWFRHFLERFYRANPHLIKKR